MSAVTATSATVAPPTAAGTWVAYQLSVCNKDDATDCLSLAVCTRTGTEASTSCAITGAVAGTTYTVQAEACADADCSGTKSEKSPLAGAPEFTAPAVE